MSENAGFPLFRSPDDSPLIPERSGSRFFTAGSWILFLIACFLFCINRAPFLGQWDSFDYVKQVVNHQFSDLGVGRPVFIACNIGLWETAKRLLHLGALDAATVIMAGVILAGALGILLFRRLSRLVLPNGADRLAAVALLLSPMYVMYSASIMTEIPMLTAALGAAVMLWDAPPRTRAIRDLAAGALFGAAIGIREQALTLGAGYCWILWIRRLDWRSRIQSAILFGLSMLAISIAPVVAIYLGNPAAFSHRLQVWMHAIPTEGSHFWQNLEASLLFLPGVCPGAWLGVIAAGFHRLRKGPSPPADSNGGPARRSFGPKLPRYAPALGILCTLILPIAALWRDADVQMHPRYALVALPGALILCAGLYHHWLPSRRAAAGWVILQLCVFGIAEISMQPYRQLQYDKRAYVERVRKAIPGCGLLIPGAFSPALDYYRALGDRPGWRILWSGWDWNAKAAKEVIRQAWNRNEPVYLCDGPNGWWFFEDERLDLHAVFKECRKDTIAPGLLRVYPVVRKNRN